MLIWLLRAEDTTSVNDSAREVLAAGKPVGFYGLDDESDAKANPQNNVVTVEVTLTE
jgi:hypothetical protein